METDYVKKHFDEEAAEYDEKFIKIIPHYLQMTDALVEAIPFDAEKSIQVLDLGCGTGNISKKVLERFNNAEICCIDIAENMIEMTKAKLAQYKNITFRNEDFAKAEFSQKFDTVVSSLAVHHLQDNEKEAFYKKIYGLINDGGCFYNADIVLAETEYLQNLNLSRWARHMKKNIPEKEVEEKWIPAHKDGDMPAKLSDQIMWLKKAGFKNIDIVWKYYNFTVFGGIK